MSDAVIVRAGEAESGTANTIMSGVIAMTDPVAEFFTALGQRGYEPLVKNVSGTVRFDISRGRRVDHWLLALHDGKIDLAHRKGEADCAVIGDQALFEAIASGRSSALAAMLRGALWVTGDPELLVHVQRLFPGPPPGRPGLSGRQTAPGRPGPAARQGPATNQRPPTTSTAARDRRRRVPVSADR
jgi:SCP-2 sterol transfer family